MASRIPQQFAERSPAWQALAFLWGFVLIAGGIGAGVLQYLGPIRHPVLPAISETTGKTEHKPTGHTETEHAAGAPDHTHPPTPAPQHATASVEPPAAPKVNPPDPALLEKAPDFPPALLPKVGEDGRMPRIVYAAPAPTAPPGTPRVALLMAGFGLSERDSRAALDQLPGPVSFAVSAYATLPRLLEAARESGHELLASIPMEPQGYPSNDEGMKSLRTSLPSDENQKNLQWALSRTQGAVGATGASDGMKGERFADVSAVFDPALEEIGRRGLLYIDPRPGRATPRPGLPNRSVDVVLDESIARAEIEAKLVSLERVARERGSAIGLAGPLRPVTIERIAAWIGTLKDRGIVLVPVSALVADKP